MDTAKKTENAYTNTFSDAEPVEVKVKGTPGRKPWLSADERRDWANVVRLTMAEGEAIEAIARYREMSVSAVLQQMAQAYIKQNRKTIEMQRQIDELKASQEGQRCRSTTVDGPSTRRRWTYRPSKPWR